MKLTPYEKGKIDVHIATGSPVAIISGEGEEGCIELYRGYPTLRDVIAHLEEIRRTGQWARAVVFSHSNRWGASGFDPETGEMRTFPEKILDELEEN